MSPESSNASAPAGRSALFAPPTFLPGQRRLLQKIATGAPVEESLDLLIQLIEAEVPGVTGIVLMLTEDGKNLTFTAGAGVHPVLREAARLLPVGEGYGTCSAAVARRERVGAPDLAQWPLPAELADVFERSCVRATWSQPFFSSKGDVLGTLCLLYTAPGRPESSEIDLIETAAHLAALAVERERLDRVRRLQAITFEILSEALIVADDEGCIIDCNQAAERMWGWKREELIGQTAAILYPPEDRNRMSSEVLDTVRRVGRWSGERPWLAKDGRRGWREVTVLRLRDQGGREVGFIGVNRDITERKHAELALRNAHQRLDYHVENSPLGFIEWGRDFQVMRWSSQAERIFGWKTEEVLGKTPMDWRLIYEEDLPGVVAAMQRLTSGTEPRLVYANRNWTRDGR
jgi:PAS domain S-box-containing protein